MTSKLTREERVQALYDLKTGQVLNPSDIENIKMLARIALAAMDSEPHPDDELSNLLWYSQEATCHSDPNYYCEFQRLATPGFIAGIILELQERRKAERDSEPVAWQIHTPETGVTYVETNPQSVENIRNGYGIKVEITPLYRHAQPAPAFPDFDNVLETLDYEVRCNAWESEHVLKACQATYDACRAAMLNGGKS